MLGLLAYTSVALFTRAQGPSIDSGWFFLDARCLSFGGETDGLHVILMGASEASKLAAFSAATGLWRAVYKLCLSATLISVACYFQKEFKNREESSLGS